MLVGRVHGQPVAKFVVIAPCDIGICVLKVRPLRVYHQSGHDIGKIIPLGARLEHVVGNSLVAQQMRLMCCFNAIATQKPLR